ncbi:MAG: hypothetical protein HOJ57_33620 [Lentisphaerae bacterium]|jgi:hypothetical protein|nr:hypothetical protein [Lentisphaerota bacterium]MBT7060694.1 hypothetical protein [Lentisphaerota bacterium]
MKYSGRAYGTSEKLIVFYVDGRPMIKSVERLELPASDGELPKTVGEAVDQLLDLLSDWDDLPTLSEMDGAALECLHVSLGPFIRNTFGLWGSNQALLDACGVDHADDAYVVILDALARRLRER